MSRLGPQARKGKRAWGYYFARRAPERTFPGTAVVLGRMAKGVPLALSHNIRCNHVLYENVLLVAVSTTETPRVSDEDKVVVAPIANGLARVELRFGFMEQPNVPKGLEVAMARGQIAKCDLSRVIYFTGHETIISIGATLGFGALARGAIRVHAS